MKSCTIITCNNCEFYNTQYCKNCSKEGDDWYEHWEWRHDVSWRQEQIDNLTQKISDLEAKLAEKEHTINTLIEDHKARQEWYQKQLAEKEERINWLVTAEFNRKWAKKYVEMRRKEEPMLCLPDSDEVYQRYFEQKDKIAKLKTQHNIDNQVIELMEDNRNKDKISFALEQLEKVKESVLGIDKTEIKTLKNGFSTLYVDRPEVITKLDNKSSN